MAETQNSRANGKSLGKYCVAGGPGNVTCKNNSENGRNYPKMSEIEPWKFEIFVFEN